MSERWAALCTCVCTIVTAGTGLMVPPWQFGSGLLFLPLNAAQVLIHIGQGGRFDSAGPASDCRGARRARVNYVWDSWGSLGANYIKEGNICCALGAALRRRTEEKLVCTGCPGHYVPSGCCCPAIPWRGCLWARLGLFGSMGPWGVRLRLVSWCCCGGSHANGLAWVRLARTRERGARG